MHMPLLRTKSRARGLLADRGFKRAPHAKLRFLPYFLAKYWGGAHHQGVSSWVRDTPFWPMLGDASAELQAYLGIGGHTSFGPKRTGTYLFYAALVTNSGRHKCGIARTNSVYRGKIPIFHRDVSSPDISRESISVSVCKTLRCTVYCIGGKHRYTTL